MEQEDRISSFVPSVTAMISGVVADAKELLISELTLTKLECQREFAKAKTAAVTVAVGVGLGFIGAIALVFMVVHFLATFTVVPLWGCFGIVGGVLALFVNRLTSLIFIFPDVATSAPRVCLSK